MLKHREQLIAVCPS